MVSVLSTAMSRLNAFLDSEMEQILCFDGSMDTETFCNSKAAIFTVHEHYYRDCYDQMLQNGRGSYMFYNVIEKEQLLEEWRRAYEAERCKQAYMKNAMIQLGVFFCGMESS